jgi:hypothetical protein
MQENRDLRPAYVTKADMTLSELTSGGKLVRDQWKKFFLVAIKDQVMMSRVRNVALKRETTEINKLTTFGSQVLHPGTESQALTLAQRGKPGFDQVTVTSTEVVCQVDYPRYVLMDQIEGSGFKNTMITYLGLHVRRDLEGLIISGNTASTNTLLALFNGIIQAATSNSYAAGGVSLESQYLADTRITMPSEYKSQGNLGYFTNEIAFDSLWREYEARGTPLGDQKLVQGASTLPFRGRTVVEVPQFPDDLGGGTETCVMFLDPKMFIFGLHEDLEMQSEYNIRERTWTVVMTARLGQVYEHEPAVVKATGITGQ